MFNLVFAWLDTKASDKTERHRKTGTNPGGHHVICQIVILLNYLVFAQYIEMWKLYVKVVYIVIIVMSF